MKALHYTLAFLLVLTTAPLVHASPGYDDQGGYSITPPSDPATTFTTVMTAFPATMPRTVGGYPLASRLLAATGRTVFLQKTFGESDWFTVATIAESDGAMDPAFLAFTPEGEKIALGGGLSRPLYVFPTSLLSVANPVVLTTSPQARRYDLPYYSGAFRGDRYLFLNVGGDVLGESFIEVIDTESASSNARTIIANIPGASGGITFDAAGDLVTGLGWDPNDQRTGDIGLFDAAAIDSALANGTTLDYDADEHVLATGLLSADSLGFDADGNLFVGGGDVFGSTHHYGYVDVVSASVVSRVVAGGAPADSTNPDDVTKIAPDPCMNDDWTGATYVPGVDMLIVSASLATTPPNCADKDWSTGAPKPGSLYFPPDAPKTDGIPDGANPNYEPQRLLGKDELSRLVNALDSKKTDPNFDASVDYHQSGTIDDSDFAFLRANWGTPVPDGIASP